MICCIIPFSLRTAYETRWYGCFGRSKWIPAARGYGKSGMLCTSLYCLSWFCSSWCSLKFMWFQLDRDSCTLNRNWTYSLKFPRYYLLSILCIRTLYNPTQHINWVLIQGAPGAQPITLKSSTPPNVKTHLFWNKSEKKDKEPYVTQDNEHPACFSCKHACFGSYYYCYTNVGSLSCTVVLLCWISCSFRHSIYWQRPLSTYCNMFYSVYFCIRLHLF